MARLSGHGKLPNSKLFCWGMSSNSDRNGPNATYPLLIVVEFCRSIFTFFCRLPMLHIVWRFRLLARIATRAATLSKPAGKSTRNVSVFICRHFVEGGLPPNSCEYEMQIDASERSSSSNFFIH